MIVSMLRFGLTIVFVVNISLIGSIGTCDYSFYLYHNKKSKYVVVVNFNKHVF